MSPHEQLWRMVENGGDGAACSLLTGPSLAAVGLRSQYSEGTEWKFRFLLDTFQMLWKPQVTEGPMMHSVLLPGHGRQCGKF